jgi:hypothetical protein
MNTVTPFAIPLTSAPVLARRDLLNLAKFRDTSGHAVSFFFSLQSIPDGSHHTEVTLVRDLVREEKHRVDIKQAPGLAEDLEAVLMQAEEVRLSPRHWRILYACHREGFSRKFELPAPKPIRQLYVGGGFLLAPMFWSLNFCTPYGVLIFERGRARIFVVRGLQIQEFGGRLPKENITLHVKESSRTSSEKHLEHHMEGHVRAYCKELAEKVRVFLAEEKLHEMVFGCREDLWGEAKPEFADLEKGILTGRFVPSDYDMPAADVRDATYPIFEENRRKSGVALLERISDEPTHGAVGVNAVMEGLIEGRVQKLMLGRPVEGTVSECDNCGHVQSRTDRPCIFCGNTSLHSLEADEGLIRQAVLTDAEILTFDGDEVPGFTGAAGLLRY